MMGANPREPTQAPKKIGLHLGKIKPFFSLGPVLKVVYWLFLVYFPSSLHQLLGNILDIPSEVGLTG